jgi:hypothetical protein
MMKKMLNKQALKEQQMKENSKGFQQFEQKKAIELKIEGEPSIKDYI